MNNIDQNGYASALPPARPDLRLPTHARRTRAPLFIALAMLAMSGSPHAAPMAYEPFNYPAGSLDSGTAATGDGFTGTWTCGVSGWILEGLTYTGLPEDNNAMRSAGSRQFVNLSTPIASGTKWISFLYKTSAGNSGANINGVYFPNGNANCLWFGFGLSPYSSTQGQLGLGSITTAGSSATSATPLELLGLGTYGNTYLVVLEIVFNTSGNNDTVTVYLNPVAGQASPGVPDAGSYAGFDVGTISGVGLNVTGAGEITVDEIRFGDSYADVVGAVVLPPDAPTGLNAVAGSNLVFLSWTAAAGSPTGYNVKRSTVSEGPYTNLIGTTTAPTVTYDDSVLGGQTYYYVVSALNTAGESADSTFASATPILAAPAAPSGLTPLAGDAQVTLNWTASEFATGYTVKRATEIAGPYGTVGSTTTTSYDDLAGLVNGTTYYYVVAATGAGGTSPDSSPVSTMPIGPLPLMAGLEQGVGITWFASNGITYQIQWSSEDLGTNTIWNNLGESIPGNGGTNTVFDSIGEPHNFYRVLSIE